MNDWLYLVEYGFGCLAVLWLFYAGLPDLLYHVLCLRIFTKGYGGERAIALTFDDGPHPVYTPQLLGLLQAQQIKATFFVVGKHVIQYPNLVQQIVDQGHELGIHGFHHTHAWWLTPWQTIKEFKHTAQAIQKITGKKPIYYRPPWGMFNLFTRYAGWKVGAEPVLWNVTGYDWRPGNQAPSIIVHILRKLTPGSIILLHDAGGAPEAPSNTLTALSEIIPYLKQLEYSFVSISELKKQSQASYQQYRQLKKSWIQPIWDIWEWAFAKLNKVRVIDPLMRLSITHWEHQSIYDIQGARIAAKGTPACEMHFRNEFLRSLSSESATERTAIKGIRQLRTSLHHIAIILEHDPRYKQVQVIFGVTLIHRGAAGAGFHVEDIPDTIGKRYLQFLLRWLMMLYHPQGAKRLRKRSHLLVPKLVWMSRRELLEQYLHVQDGRGRKMHDKVQRK